MEAVEELEQIEEEEDALKLNQEGKEKEDE